MPSGVIHLSLSVSERVSGNSSETQTLHTRLHMCVRAYSF